MRKSEFLKLLEASQHSDQPILKIDMFWYAIHLIPSPSWGADRTWDQKRKVDATRGAINGAGARLLEKFRKYNQWLAQWYQENSPGSHLTQRGEFTTQLRALGWDETTVTYYVEKDLGKEAP